MTNEEIDTMVYDMKQNIDMDCLHYDHDDQEDNRIRIREIVRKHLKLHLLSVLAEQSEDRNETNY